MIKCQKCGELIEEGKKYCPDCGNSLIQHGKKTGKPIAGGILIIIAAVFCLVASIFVLLTKLYSPYDDNFQWWVLIIVIFAIWGFAIGLTGGIFSLKRRHFPIAIIGASFVLVGGWLDFFGTIIFGIVIVILGIIATILIAVSKNEFTVSNR